MEKINSCFYRDKRFYNERKKKVLISALEGIWYSNGRPIFEDRIAHCSLHEVEYPVICELKMAGVNFGPARHLYVPMTLFTPYMKEYTSIFSINILESDNEGKTIVKECEFKYKWRNERKSLSQWVGGRLYLESQTVHIQKSSPDSCRQTLKTLFVMCGDKHYVSIKLLI